MESPNLSDIGARILYPAPGTIIAFDPDIPPENHVVYFEASRPGRWHLDGRTLETGALVAWTPRSGRHRLTLFGRDGRFMDSLEFEVRGMPGFPKINRESRIE